MLHRRLPLFQSCTIFLILSVLYHNNLFFSRDTSERAAKLETMSGCLHVPVFYEMQYLALGFISLSVDKSLEKRRIVADCSDEHPIVLRLCLQPRQVTWIGR
jgi:hypothetical protein